MITNLLRATAVLVLLSLVSSQSLAESGGVAVLPQGGKPKHKVQVILDTRWVDSNGYRPVRVTVVQWPAGKAPADRQFRVTLSGDSYGSRPDITVTDVIDLPEGQASATKSIAIPQCNQSWRFHVTVREDGMEIPEMEADLSFPNRHGYGNWSESTPSLLFIDRDAPTLDQQLAIVERLKRTGLTKTNQEDEAHLFDLRNLALVFPDPTGAVKGEAIAEDVKPNDALVLSLLSDAPRQLLAAPRDLPKRWIEWTCFDIAFLPLDDLQSMAKEQPDQFAALQDWLRAGGTLGVHGTGDKFTRIKELEGILQITEEPTTSYESTLEEGEESDSETRDTTRPSGWRPPRRGDLGQGLRAQAELATATNYGPYSSASAMQRALPTKPAPSKADAKIATNPPYLVRQVSFGKVVVFAKDNPFPGKVADWQAVFNSIGAEHWMWFRRHGMSLTRNNDSYWQFLIPGVGKAPVMTFLVLISFFMIVIGPLNYSWLKRRGRLHLLLITVPAGAALMVSGLFIFAVLTDGLSVQTRVRSFTRLDQTNHRAASWSRQTYYASLAPSRGLLFPESAAVYPLEAEPVSRRGRRAGGRTIEWDDAQRLRAGYLYPRTAAQFLVINCDASPAELQVTAAPGDMQVTNRLGSSISLVILRDQKGQCYQGSDIRENGSQSLEPLTLQEAFDLWTRHLRTDRPELPADWNVSQENLFSWIGGSRYNYWGIDGQAADASQATSLLEQGLTSGDPGKFELRLPPQSYLAAVSAPVATPLGLNNARARASVHVVQGIW